MKSLEQENKLFENSSIIVYHNGSGEIFIKHKESTKTLRIGDDYKGNLHATASSERGHIVMTPYHINGLLGFQTYS